jgi:non-ribosomal peptide synthetase component F
VQYKDFTAWQNRLFQSQHLIKQEHYWLSVFSPLQQIPVLNIHTDFPRPPVQIFEGNYLEFQFTPQLTEKIRATAADSGATLYMILLTFYNILLSRLSGQEDIVVGVPIQGRRHPDLANLIGFFVNTLAMRNRPGGEKTFREFLEEVKTNALNGYENQDYQFDELVARLGIPPDPSRQPLFSTMFEHLNAAPPRLESRTGTHREKKNATSPRQLSFKPYKFENNIIQFDLLLHAFDRQEIIAFKLLYSSKLFKPETIARFCQYFGEIAETVLENLQIPLKDIKITHGLIDEKLENSEEEQGDFVF